jgi:hypothetical protein
MADDISGKVNDNCNDPFKNSIPSLYSKVFALWYCLVH